VDCIASLRDVTEKQRMAFEGDRRAKVMIEFGGETLLRRHRRLRHVTTFHHFVIR
jgi:hypothetical protein